MSTKLTLTVEKTVIEQAKKFAALKGQSLSELVENYFKMLTTDIKPDPEPAPPLSPKVKALKGILKPEGMPDYKQIISEEILKKHGS